MRSYLAPRPLRIELYRYLFSLILLMFVLVGSQARAEQMVNTTGESQSLVTKAGKNALQNTNADIPAVSGASEVQEFEYPLLDHEQRLPWSQRFRSNKKIDASMNLTISGINPNTAEVLIVLRLDDANSSDYFSRVNIERQVAPGPFSLDFSLKGIRRSDGELPDLTSLKKMTVFYGRELDKNFKDIQLKTVFISKVKPVAGSMLLSERSDASQDVKTSGALVLDFGTESSSILKGTQQVTDKRHLFQQITLKGSLRGVDRPGPDPWLRDGIAGVDQIRIPVDHETSKLSRFWRLTLFREDIGEWENLPRQMNLDIKMNGKLYSGQHDFKDARDWYHNAYLSFYRKAATDDPWNDIVRHRGLVQQYPVEISEELLKKGSLEINLQGDSPQQRYVSGLVFEPIDVRGQSLVSEVNRRRENYFNQHWHHADATEKIRESIEGRTNTETSQLALNQPYSLQFPITIPGNADKDESFIRIDTPKKLPFKIETRIAVPQWMRAGSNFRLEKQYRYASELVQAGNKHAGNKQGDDSQTEKKKQSLKPGNYVLHLLIYPENKLSVGDADVYPFEVVLESGNQAEKTLVKHALDVLPIHLPLPEQSVGVYLDQNPALNWFEPLKQYQLAQSYCDLTFLQKTGLKALAPPMVTPVSNQQQAWQRQLALYRKFYPDQEILAYTPFKRLSQWLKEDALQSRLNAVQPDYDLYWSIADEAHQKQFNEINNNASLLHSANRFAKTAGHLNNPNQKSLLKSLDLALINHGFGVRKQEIARFKSDGDGKSNKLWLYNMPRFRLAAGAFLWHSGADAYVQWHGRMPTANPYDPTDGREADYQFFPPQPEVCHSVPDVDLRLFDLMTGYTDLAWLTWLQQQESSDARQLIRKIRQSLGDDWQRASRLSDDDIDSMIKEITIMARRLKYSDRHTQDVMQNANNLGGDDESAAGQSASNKSTTAAIYSRSDSWLDSSLPERLVF